MAGADVCVNLRHPTMGETSGSVIRALSLGKPLVVSDVGWFSELPGDVALKVPVDERETVDLEGALELLLSREDVRGKMGRAAAKLARREHDLERVADRYAAALEEAAGGPAVLDTVLREVSEAAADVGIAPATRESSGSPSASPRSILRRSLGRVPVWVWLAAIVGLSALFRSLLGRGIVAPFIIVDEILWSEVARGLADAGEPLVRDTPDPGSGSSTRSSSHPRTSRSRAWSTRTRP